MRETAAIRPFGRMQSLHAGTEQDPDSLDIGWLKQQGGHMNYARCDEVARHQDTHSEFASEHRGVLGVAHRLGSEIQDGVR